MNPEHKLKLTQTKKKKKQTKNRQNSSINGRWSISATPPFNQSQQAPRSRGATTGLCTGHEEAQLCSQEPGGPPGTSNPEACQKMVQQRRSAADAEPSTKSGKNNRHMSISCFSGKETSSIQLASEGEGEAAAAGWRPGWRSPSPQGRSWCPQCWICVCVTMMTFAP